MIMGDINLEMLDARLSDILQKVGITQSQTLLQLTDNDFLKLGNITFEDINVIRKVAAETLLPNTFIPVSSLLQNIQKKWDRLSTGCDSFNNLLNGGIARRGITELSGESGSGKTQICLQLTIMVQLPVTSGGFSAGAIYICTEDKFPSTRFQQLLNTFPLCYNENKHKLGDNVFIEHIADVDGLKNCVSVQIPHLLKQQNIGLIIIDSITAVFRVDYNQNDMIQRAKDLRTVGLQLHNLANEYSISVLCVNQVSSVIHKDNSFNNILIPALGLAWANLVTTRLQAIRNGPQHRSLHVIFTPDLPSRSCTYEIRTDGVF